MYLAANFNVWIFDSLSDGRVGMILRKAENASFRLCVRCRSRTLAKTRWDWTSWCWRWFNSSVGEALLPLPELDPWSMSLAADLCLWCSRLCLLHEAPPSCSWCWWWLLWWTLLSPLCSDPPESESNEFSDRRLRLFCWWWWYWLWWLFGGERLFSCCMWCMWLSSYSWWPVLNNSGSVDEKRKRPKIEFLFVFENEFGGVKFEWMCGYIGLYDKQIRGGWTNRKEVTCRNAVAGEGGAPLWWTMTECPCPCLIVTISSEFCEEEIKKPTRGFKVWSGTDRVYFHSSQKSGCGITGTQLQQRWWDAAPNAENKQWTLLLCRGNRLLKNRLGGYVSLTMDVSRTSAYGSVYN